MLQTVFHHMRPGLFALQIVSVGASGVLLGVIAFVAITATSDGLRHTINESEAALLTSTIDQSTDYVDLLIDSERKPDGSVVFSPAITVRVYEQIRLQQDSARRLVVIDPSPDAWRLRGLAEEKEGAFRRFAETGDPLDFAKIHSIHRELNTLAERMAPQLWKEAQGDSAEATIAADQARAMVVGVAVLVLAWLLVTTALIARRMRQALARSEEEQHSLARSAASVVRRNEQFETLYEVGVDNADEADAAQIAQSTVTSSRRLLRSDISVIWLTSGDAISMAAADSVRAWEHDGSALSPAVAKRVAARGRSMILGAGSDSRPSGADGVSGVLVPLIVRSRVAGVLACWSASGVTFTEDDRRLLEMLAAQVAPAILAADRYRESEARANTDALTGLLNRRQLTEDILARYAPALDQGRSLSAVLIDVDNFKTYNDRYGHSSGDEALRALARILEHGVRPTDRVYRYGGEEFLLVLEDTSSTAASALMAGLEQQVQATEDSAELPAGFTISAGIASAPEHTEEFAELLEHADTALYDSKAQGRNRTTTWGSVPIIRVAA